MPRLPVLILACAVLAGTARAQDSEFGISGPGTPGRWESVGARAAAGAFAAFDPGSPLTEAAMVGLRSLTANTGAAASTRNVDAPGSNTWLRGVRYPVFGVAGPVGKGVFVGGGFSTYLDRTYNVVTRDSVLIRGAMQPYRDALASDGAVNDIRVAAATRLGPHVAVGAAVHFITGSTRMTATRTFDDSTAYVTAPQRGIVRYTGEGISASALITVSSALSFAALARRDNHLNAHVGDSLVAHSELPTTLGGALEWSPIGAARLGGSVVWRSWSGVAPNAFDTVNWTAGLELGRNRPIRVGVRGGQLPFSTSGSAPTEFGIAAGTARAVASGHGLVDVGLERLARSDGTVHETVWTLLIGIAIRP
jgi:hypothetical protein